MAKELLENAFDNGIDEDCYRTPVTSFSREGTIPDWVCGSLYRNGPYLDEVKTVPLLQRLHIEKQKVTYQTRFLQSDTAPTQRFLDRFNVDEVSDNTIVTFFPLQDELYTTTMSTNVHRIDPDSLETLEKVNISQHVPVDSACAHPHIDSDGTLYNIGSSHGHKDGPTTCFFKLLPKEDLFASFPQGEIVSTSKMSNTRLLNYKHSFLMTDNFYIYIEQPLHLNETKTLAAKMRGDSYMPILDFKSDTNARFRVIDRETGDEINKEFKYEMAPLTVFHHINAYEENGYVIVDVCGYKNDASMHYVHLQKRMCRDGEAFMRKLEVPEPRRYVIPITMSHSTPIGENLVDAKFGAATAVRRNKDTVFCDWETLADTGFEFATINYKQYNGRKYRYSYGVGWHNTGKHFNTVCKIDAGTQTFVEWEEDNCFPSESTFVSNFNPTSEDDGVLLSAINRVEPNGDKDAFLLVLEAKTMKEVARVTFKGVTDFGLDFHALFRENKKNCRKDCSISSPLGNIIRELEITWL